jgi:hypothetical protein
MVGPIARELGAHQQRHDPGHREGGDRSDQVEHADPLVVGGEDPFLEIHLTGTSPQVFLRDLAALVGAAGSAAEAAAAAEFPHASSRPCIRRLGFTMTRPAM